MPRKKRYVAPHTTLTDKERNLLQYPPTEGTWFCDGSYTTEKSGEVITIKCNAMVSKRYDKCTLCGTPKSSEPRLAWPLYVDACNKVGFEPGKYLWMLSQHSGRPMWKERGSDEKWKEWVPPEVPVETMTRVKNGKVRTRSRKRKV